MKLNNTRMAPAGAALLATLAAAQNCPLPSTYAWTDSGLLAEPQSGWNSLKDFTHATYEGQNLVYATFQSSSTG